MRDAHKENVCHSVVVSKLIHGVVFVLSAELGSQKQETGVLSCGATNGDHAVCSLLLL